jgi:hypothetical protein
MHLITVPPERRDKHLQQKLLAERDGILAWAVQGCLDWQRHGRLDPLSEIVQPGIDAKVMQRNFRKWPRQDRELTPSRYSPVFNSGKDSAHSCNA